MQLCQLQQNGHLIRSSTIRHPSSGKPVPLNSYVTHSLPVGSSNRGQSNPYGITQGTSNQPITNKETVSRSVYLKGETPEIQISVKDLKQKINCMNKLLLEHESKIITLQGKKSFQLNKQNSVQRLDFSKMNGSVEKNKHLEDRMLSQIQKLRQEMKTSGHLHHPSAPESTKLIQSIQQNLNTTQSQLLVKIKELRQKTYNQLKLMNQSFRKQLQQQIHNTQDINKTVFNKIQKDILQLQKKIGTNVQEIYSKQKSGKQKYLGVLQMIKFKQIVQKHTLANGKEKEKKQDIVINEGTYFLDKDGYLLDKEGYYITGDDDQWIQLNARQIKILRAYNILKQ